MPIFSFCYFRRQSFFSFLIKHEFKIVSKRYGINSFLISVKLLFVCFVVFTSQILIKQVFCFNKRNNGIPFTQLEIRSSVFLTLRFIDNLNRIAIFFRLM